MKLQARRDPRSRMENSSTRWLVITEQQLDRMVSVTQEAPRPHGHVASGRDVDRARRQGALVKARRPGSVRRPPRSFSCGHARGWLARVARAAGPPGAGIRSAGGRWPSTASTLSMPAPCAHGERLRSRWDALTSVQQRGGTLCPVEDPSPRVPRLLESTSWLSSRRPRPCCRGCVGGRGTSQRSSLVVPGRAYEARKAHQFPIGGLSESREWSSRAGHLGESGVPDRYCDGFHEAERAARGGPARRHPSAEARARSSRCVMRPRPEVYPFGRPGVAIASVIVPACRLWGRACALGRQIVLDARPARTAVRRLRPPRPRLRGPCPCVEDHGLVVGASPGRTPPLPVQLGPNVVGGHRARPSAW